MKRISLEKGQIQPSGMLYFRLKCYLSERKHTLKLELFGHLFLSSVTVAMNLFLSGDYCGGKRKKGLFVVCFFRKHFNLKHT